MRKNLFSFDSVLLTKVQRAAREKRRKFMHRLGICQQRESSKQNKMVILGISFNSLLAFLGQCIYLGGDKFVQDRIKSANNATTGRDKFDPFFFCVHPKKKRKISTPCKTPLMKQLCDRQMKSCSKIKESVHQTKTEFTALNVNQAPT